MLKKKMFFSLGLIGCLFISGCVGPSQSLLSAQYPLIKITRISGAKYFNLKELAKTYEMKLSIDNTTGIVFLDNAGQKIKILPGTKKVLVDQRVRNLGKLIKEKGDNIYMPLSFLIFLKKEKVVYKRKPFKRKTCYSKNSSHPENCY